MRFKLVIGVGLVVVGSLLNLLLPWCLKFIVEDFNRPALFFTLILLLISYGLIWVISRLIIDLRQIIVYRFFERGVHKFTSMIFQKILSLSMKYHSINTTGSMMNSIERAQVSIPIILYGVIFIVLPMVVEVFIAAGVLWYCYGIGVSSILFLIFLSYVLFTWFCIPWLVEAQRKGNMCHQRVSDYITDVLMNVEGIYYQSAQKPVSQECEQRMMDRENAFTKQLMRMDTVSIGQTLITGVGFICMNLLIGLRVTNHELVVSDFVMINGYLIQFLVPLSIIGTSLLRNIRVCFTRMEDVTKLLNEKDDVVDKLLAKNIKDAPFDISFNNVTFSYSGSKKHILKDVNFCLPEGKAMAIVGHNGAGKSTIIKLLYRLFDVSKGEITVQNEDIRNIKLFELRKTIGMVPQETFLLNDTIQSNLFFGLEHQVPDDMFKKITQLTNIEEWVNTLPDKYMALVGEQGIRLSGGQKKRIGIARVLLRNPKILVLDEAMSFLDSEVEKQIVTHINEAYDGLTKIIITHHEKHLSNVDIVLYLENGSVHGYGSHEELLIKNEKYKRLWEK